MIFLVGGIISSLLLLPTLLSQTARVPRTTSVPTAILLLVYGVTFLSLGMTTASLGSFISFVLWVAIAGLKH
jgi:hypothetical protein